MDLRSFAALVWRKNYALRPHWRSEAQCTEAKCFLLICEMRMTNKLLGSLLDPSPPPVCVTHLTGSLVPQADLSDEIWGAPWEKLLARTHLEGHRSTATLGLALSPSRHCSAGELHPPADSPTPRATSQGMRHMPTASLLANPARASCSTALVSSCTWTEKHTPE